METTQTVQTTSAPETQQGYVGAEGNFGRPSLDSLMPKEEKSDFFGASSETEEKEEASAPLKEESKDDVFSKAVEDERKKFQERQRLAREKKLKEDSEKNKEPEFDIDKLIKEVLGDKDEAKDEAPKSFTKEDVERLVQEKLEHALKEQETRSTETKVVSDFKAKISNHVKENAEKYPLLDASGSHDMVYDIIEQDYMTNVDQYGEQWAMENIMSTDKASEMVQKHLASEFTKVLESNHVKGFILKHYGINVGDQSSQTEQSRNPTTLSNDNFSSMSTPTSEDDDRNLTQEQRFARAMAALK